MKKLFGAHDLEHYLDRFIHSEEVKNEIKVIYEEPEADQILNLIQHNKDLGNFKDNIYDLILDLILNCENGVVGLSGWSTNSNSEFGINILEFAGVYFVRAPEFDDSDFFNSKKEAIKWAEYNYETYITDYYEHQDDEDFDE